MCTDIEYTRTLPLTGAGTHNHTHHHHTLLHTHARERNDTSESKALKSQNRNLHQIKNEPSWNAYGCVLGVRIKGVYLGYVLN